MLTLVGEGQERKKVEEVTSELQVGGAVRLLGAKEDLVPVFHDADVYVSAAHVEGFGISVAEAAATGMPAVCMSVPGGLREVVIDGDTGYLIPNNDDNLFRAMVSRLCRDVHLRAKLGAAARDHVARNFALPEIAGLLERSLVA
jgi:glycosyltransferase involved in cell wall biosynthesis